ncbi:MAG: MaoC family dehydratase N-terminal domain-containing protein [Gammaproteobacteria bacterium]|nr:MaoC family dehydratase N-terminal domain-containing protein [Gammaproteobacteria bacterium]
MMFDLEAVSAQWLGFTTEKMTAKYPVEHEPIRRHCQMVGNTNPLYLEPGYVEKTPCPPTAIPIFALSGRLPPDPKPRTTVLDIGLPVMGQGFTNMSREQEYLKPVYVGDHLAMQMRIIELYQKPTRLDPDSLWIVTEDLITNQNDELVCLVRNTLLNFRTDEEWTATGVTKP